MVISFDWPDELPQITRGGKDRPETMEDVLVEVLEPFNRDNIVWYDARLELARVSEGSY
jgi:hypothetical protein